MRVALGILAGLAVTVGVWFGVGTLIDEARNHRNTPWVFPVAVVAGLAAGIPVGIIITRTHRKPAAAKEPAAGAAPEPSAALPPRPIETVKPVRLRVAVRGAFTTYYCLMALFAVSLVAMVYMAFRLTYGVSGPNDPAHLFTNPSARPFAVGGLVCLALAVLSGIAMAIVRRLAARLKVVNPLTRGHGIQYALTEEGVYASELALAHRNHQLYRLCPWDSLSLYLVDERRARIILRHKRTVLKLGARLDFGLTRSVVLAHLAPERQTPIARRPGFRWAVLGLGALVVIAAGFGTGTYVEARSTGPVGDHRCDICGIGGPRGITIRTPTDAGSYRITREYCLVHGVGYAITHPGTTVRGAARALSGGSQYATEVLLLVAVPVAIWAGLIWFVVRLAMPAWQRAPLLRE